MLWHIWSFLSLLTLDRVYVASEIMCEPGQMATHSRTSCVPCPAKQYNPKKGSRIECQNCEPCALFSYEVSTCTPKSNTKCRCHEGFIPFNNSTKRCKCPKGSGIELLENGYPICKKCPPNSSQNPINSECQPQHVIPGSVTCDVNCRNKSKTLVEPSSSHLPYSQTSASTSTTTPTTSRNVSTTVSSAATSIPELNDIRKHAPWLVFLAAFLLLILIHTCIRCPKKKSEIVRQGSSCGKPVEESGEKFIPPF